MILGTGIMLILLTITFAIVQTFIIRNNGWDAQMAADSIADGTAVYMATDGNDYNDAVKKSKELQSIVKKNTGIDTQNVTVNKNKLKDDDEVQIDLSVTEFQAALSLELPKANLVPDIIGENKVLMNSIVLALYIGVIDRPVQQVHI